MLFNTDGIHDLTGRDALHFGVFGHLSAPQILLAFDPKAPKTVNTQLKVP